MSVPARPALRARWIGRLALAALTAVAATALPSAAAHDVLVSSSPADGATVDVAPEVIRLTFSDRVLAVGTAVQVAGPAGPVHRGHPMAQGAVVTQAVRHGVPAGRYVVRWQVASADGHPVAGRLTFVVRRPQSTSSAPGTPSTASLTSAATVRSVRHSDSAGSRPAAGGLALVLFVLAGAVGVWLRRRRRR